jgi:hypothetical protein
MKTSSSSPSDAKAVFRSCGTCSQTFAHLLNREFGHPDKVHEKAIDPLAGGVLRHGHQCGMLWGAALAVGAEAYRKTASTEEAQALALSATQQVVASFVNRTDTVNCREITGVNMQSTLGLIKFMVKTMVTGMNNSQCFNLAEDWAPEAVHAAEEGLQAPSKTTPSGFVNCASIVAQRLGATEEETAMVAGFAGGLGLSGKACGALAAAIWMKTLAHVKANPEKDAPFFRHPEGKQSYLPTTGNDRRQMDCEEICGRQFAIRKTMPIISGRGDVRN